MAMKVYKRYNAMMVPPLPARPALLSVAHEYVDRSVYPPPPPPGGAACGTWARSHTLHCRPRLVAALCSETRQSRTGRGKSGRGRAGEERSSGGRRKSGGRAGDEDWKCSVGGVRSVMTHDRFDQ